MAEFGCCHRNEAHGALHGLMRVRQMTQDDAHIFCREDQIDLNAKRRVVLDGAVTRAQGALDTAQQDLESAETRQLRAQLDEVLSHQQAAGDAAERSWQQEQDSINGRLAAHAKGELALNEQMVAQLNGRMHRMPSRQKVIAEAREPFVPQIGELQARLEASIDLNRVGSSLFNIARSVPDDLGGLLPQ